MRLTRLRAAPSPILFALHADRTLWCCVRPYSFFSQRGLRERSELPRYDASVLIGASASAFQECSE
ncbi:hypothetical protein BC375_00805 [Xylella fastidiosa]|nr:hypothetical protein BC375_00805 [Xylella fastidiosa]